MIVINWRDTTHFDSEDDYRTDRRNVSNCQQQQSYSGLRSTGRSNSTYFWNDSWVQTFHKKFYLRDVQPKAKHQTNILNGTFDSKIFWVKINFRIL